MELRYKFVKKRITYTGEELSSHWIYRNFNILGNAMVAFIGPAEVREHLVDLVDRKGNRCIISRLMLHFISEYFDMDLEKTILCQRLFIALLGEEINRISKGRVVERRFNDLYAGDKKLSVAIATLTPVSCAFHVGLNIISAGVPVEAIGLRELSVPPKTLADNVFKTYKGELESMRGARAKVRGVL